MVLEDKKIVFDGKKSQDKVALIKGRPLTCSARLGAGGDIPYFRLRADTKKTP